jgi:hypothetical protein
LPSGIDVEIERTKIINSSCPDNLLNTPPKEEGTLVNGAEFEFLQQANHRAIAVVTVYPKAARFPAAPIGLRTAWQARRKRLAIA